MHNEKLIRLAFEEMGSVGLDAIEVPNTDSVYAGRAWEITIRHNGTSAKADIFTGLNTTIDIDEDIALETLLLFAQAAYDYPTYDEYCTTIATDEGKYEEALSERDDRHMYSVSVRACSALAMVFTEEELDALMKCIA
jgi:hypothetical protein